MWVWHATSVRFHLERLQLGHLYSKLNTNARGHPRRTRPHRAQRGATSTSSNVSSSRLVVLATVPGRGVVLRQTRAPAGIRRAASQSSLTYYIVHKLIDK